MARYDLPVPVPPIRTALRWSETKAPVASFRNDCTAERCHSPETAIPLFGKLSCHSANHRSNTFSYAVAAACP